MQKRRPFFIKNNFQLKFILCYIAVLALGVLLSAWLIYRALEGIIEEAAFSSHLSLASSGDLFWRTIVQINLWIAVASALISLVVIIAVHVYLEIFFRSLGQGLDNLAKGDFSFRLKTRGRWFGRQLMSDVNGAAARLDDNAKEIRKLLHQSLELLRSDRPEILSELKAAHQKLRRSRCP